MTRTKAAEKWPRSAACHVSFPGSASERASRRSASRTDGGGTAHAHTFPEVQSSDEGGSRSTGAISRGVVAHRELLR